MCGGRQDGAIARNSVTRNSIRREFFEAIAQGSKMRIQYAVNNFSREEIRELIN